MALLTGEWKIVADGHQGTLIVEGVTATGELQFRLRVPGLDVPPESSQCLTLSRGYWDEGSQSITLHVTNIEVVGVDLSSFTATGGRVAFGFRDSLIFRGHQFPTPRESVAPQDIVWTLVGGFSLARDEAWARPGGTRSNARRSQFGWYATISQAL